MIDLIVAKAKTGAWKNIIPFGFKLPPAPYIVVKEEPTNLGYIRWRFIGHAPPEQQILLRSYIKKDIYNLFHNVPIFGVSPDTRYIKLEAMPYNQTSAFSIVSDDGTISMEAIFQQFSTP